MTVKRRVECLLNAKEYASESQSLLSVMMQIMKSREHLAQIFPHSPRSTSKAKVTETSGMDSVDISDKFTSSLQDARAVTQQDCGRVKSELEESDNTRTLIPTIPLLIGNGPIPAGHHATQPNPDPTDASGVEFLPSEAVPHALTHSQTSNACEDQTQSIVDAQDFLNDPENRALLKSSQRSLGLQWQARSSAHSNSLKPTFFSHSSRASIASRNTLGPIANAGIHKAVSDKKKKPKAGSTLDCVSELHNYCSTHRLPKPVYENKEIRNASKGGSSWSISLSIGERAWNPQTKFINIKTARRVVSDKALRALKKSTAEANMEQPHDVNRFNGKNKKDYWTTILRGMY